MSDDHDDVSDFLDDFFSCICWVPRNFVAFLVMIAMIAGLIWLAGGFV